MPDPARYEARRPRSVVKIAGVEVEPLEWSVDSNSFYQADTFRLRVPLNGLPRERRLDWMAKQEDIEIEIFVGFPADAEHYTAQDLQSVFFGRVDDMDPDLGARVVSLSGRDLTGKLIDHKTSEKYPNLTASQIAAKIAERNGLTAVVTDTAGYAGRIYGEDHVRIQDEQTEWDLLTWLAREQDFVVYVHGKELHFEPRPDENGRAYKLEWTERENLPPNFPQTSIQLSRSLTLAKDISVTVKSWNAKAKKSYSVTKTRVTRANKGRTSQVQKYSYTIPGLTQDQAQARAEAILHNLTLHEMKISVSGPADNALEKTDIIKLSGTGTAWDQVYYPSSVSRSFGLNEGYSWHIEAKNHNVESEPTL